jgi:carbon storage regulator CsrA
LAAKFGHRSTLGEQASHAGALEGERMLVISRKLGEKLRIGDDVIVTVLEISGSRVVLGIDAPREISIRRVGPAVGFHDEDEQLARPVDPPLETPNVPKAATETTPPFEYPTRAVPESSERRGKPPVVTVRRSRKVTLPINGGTG